MGLITGKIAVVGSEPARRASTEDLVYLVAATCHPVRHGVAG
jgi:hypothetical protein